MLPNLFRQFFLPEYMVRKEFRNGALPSAGEAYHTATAVAGPSVVEYGLVALITMADTIMVSGEGTLAIAAVGLCNQPRFIVLAAVLSLNVAVVSVTARRKGERDRVGACSTLKQSLVISLCLSLVLSLLAHIFCRQILTLAGAQSDTIDLASQYFRILTYGIPASCVSLTISSGQRGIGQTRISMVVNMLANMVNLCFNYLLIGGNFGFPRLGVQGAAIATVIGWVVGLVVALVSVAHPDRYLYIFSPRGWRFERRTMHSIWTVASGAALEQLCMRIGFLLYNRIVASLGSTIYAIQIICINLLNMSFCIGEGLSVAASSLCGQNLGAKRPDLSRLYGKVFQRLALLTSATLFLVFLFFGRALVSLFSPDPVIQETGSRIIIIAGIIVLGQSSQQVYVGMLRGAGDSRYVAMMSILTILILRPGLAWLFVYPVGIGIYGAWCSFFIDQYLRLLFTGLRVRSGGWIHIKL